MSILYRVMDNKYIGRFRVEYEDPDCSGNLIVELLNPSHEYDFTRYTWPRELLADTPGEALHQYRIRLKNEEDELSRRWNNLYGMINALLEKYEHV